VTLKQFFDVFTDLLPNSEGVNTGRTADSPLKGHGVDRELRIRQFFFLLFYVFVTAETCLPSRPTARYCFPFLYKFPTESCTQVLATSECSQLICCRICLFAYQTARLHVPVVFNLELRENILRGIKIEKKYLSFRDKHWILKVRFGVSHRSSNISIFHLGV
jgi:hypothetical protein